MPPEPSPAGAAPRPAPLARRRGARTRAALLAAASLSGSACISQTPAGTWLGTDPKGALVLLDGDEIGYVTPCKIALDVGDDHTIRFELPGYEPVEVELEPARRVGFVAWFSATNGNSGLVSPVFLPWYDFFAPIRTDRALSPSRIFVRLQPAAGVTAEG